MKEVHPFAAVAIRFMQSMGCAVDVPSMAWALSGRSDVRADAGRNAARAYMHVADDVLNCLRDAGFASRDDDGWFQLTHAGESVYTEDYPT